MQRASTSRAWSSPSLALKGDCKKKARRTLKPVDHEWALQISHKQTTDLMQVDRCKENANPYHVPKSIMKIERDEKQLTTKIDAHTNLGMPLSQEHIRNYGQRSSHTSQQTQNLRGFNAKPSMIQRIPTKRKSNTAFWRVFMFLRHGSRRWRSFDDDSIACLAIRCSDFNQHELWDWSQGLSLIKQTHLAEMLNHLSISHDS